MDVNIYQIIAVVVVGNVFQALYVTASLKVQVKYLEKNIERIDDDIKVVHSRISRLRGAG